MVESSQRPKIKSTLQFFQSEEGLYHVYDLDSSRHFKMGKLEVEWIKLVDGTRSRADFTNIIPEEFREEFFSNLDSMGLMEGLATPRKLNPFKLQCRIFNPSKLLDRIETLSILYRILLNVLSPFLLCANAALLIILREGMAHSAITLRPTFGIPVIAYLFAILLVSFVHESSHALLAKSFGVNVPAVGVMLYLLNPMFYVDVSGIGILQNKSQRINVMLAGVMSNNLLVTLALIAYFLCRQHAVSSYFVYFILLNVGLMAVNIIPFVEFDGYYVFREMLDETEFAGNARSSLRGESIKSLEYVIYALVSYVFSSAMMISIILLFKSYALRLFDDSITDRVAIVLIFGVCFVQFKELLAHIRLQQDEPHVSNLNRSSIWLYRSFIGAVAVMFVLVKNIVSIELVSISGCVVLFASIPWLIHICSCRADKIYRELFNCACIYMSLKLQILWHWHYQGFGQLRFLQDTGTFFNIIREASFMILGAAVAITILFYGMSFVAVILLHGMRVMRRWHCAVPKLPDQCVD